MEGRPVALFHHVVLIILLHFYIIVGMKSMYTYYVLHLYMYYNIYIYIYISFFL